MRSIKSIALLLAILNQNIYANTITDCADLNLLNLATGSVCKTENGWMEKTVEGWKTSEGNLWMFPNEEPLEHTAAIQSCASKNAHLPTYEEVEAILNKISYGRKKAAPQFFTVSVADSGHKDKVWLGSYFSDGMAYLWYLGSQQTSARYFVDHPFHYLCVKIL